MALSDLSAAAGAAAYYTEGFRNTLSTHIPYLISSHVTQVAVSEKQDVRYRYDFNGLMQDLSIPKKMWWITMRLNGFHRTDEYVGGLLNILKVDEDTVDSLLATHLAMS